MTNAQAYGVEAERSEDPEELTDVLRGEIEAEAPRLIEARVAAGMALA